MKVNSTVKMNFGKIRQITGAQVRALEMTAEALHTEVVQAQVIPRDTGALQNEKFFNDYSQSGSGKATLSCEGPYARRLYFHPEYHFGTGENPNAKGKWLEDWLPGGKHDNFCKKAFMKFFKGMAGV